MRDVLARAAVLLLALCFCMTAMGAVLEDGFAPEDYSGGGSGTGDAPSGGGAPVGDQPVSRALAALSQDPVAMMELNNIYVSTSAAGCYVSGVTWYDSDGNQANNGTFSTSTYRVEIRLDTMQGYYFPENVQGFINNVQCQLSRDPSGAYVVLSKEYAPAIWSPVINNSPKSVTIEEGEWADFWVSGSYVQSYEWHLESPDGERLELADIQEEFPHVPVPDNYKDTLIINNVPASMNGWKVICTFVSAGSISKKDSKPATITIKGVEEEAEPSPSPSPSPSPTPSPSPSPSQAPEEHVHRFPAVWLFDTENHWRECSCKERQSEEPHDFQWTVLQEPGKDTPGQEEGVCQVCGYKTVREITAEQEGGQDQEKGPLSGSMRTLRTVFFVIVGLVAVAVVVIIVMAVQNDRRRRRRRRRH